MTKITILDLPSSSPDLLKLTLSESNLIVGGLLDDRPKRKKKKKKKKTDTPPYGTGPYGSGPYGVTEDDEEYYDDGADEE
jgi:hypothetical protein